MYLPCVNWWIAGQLLLLLACSCEVACPLLVRTPGRSSAQCIFCTSISVIQVCYTALYCSSCCGSLGNGNSLSAAVLRWLLADQLAAAAGSSYQFLPGGDLRDAKCQQGRVGRALARHGDVFGRYRLVLGCSLHVLCSTQFFSRTDKQHCLATATATSTPWHCNKLLILFLESIRITMARLFWSSRVNVDFKSGQSC